MTDLAPPLLALALALLLGAGAVFAFGAAADCIPAVAPATAAFADRVDASDTTWPQNDATDTASNAGVAAVEAVSAPQVAPPHPLDVTPPRTWTRGLPCRGCGPSRHTYMSDEGYDRNWYGELWR